MFSWVIRTTLTGGLPNGLHLLRHWHPADRGSVSEADRGVFFHADLMALEWNFMEVFYRTRWYSPPRNQGLAGNSMYLGLVVGVFNSIGVCVGLDVERWGWECNHPNMIMQGL